MKFKDFNNRDKKKISEVTGDKKFDSMLGKITQGAGAKDTTIDNAAVLHVLYEAAVAVGDLKKLLEVLDSATNGKYTHLIGKDTFESLADISFLIGTISDDIDREQRG